MASTDHMATPEDDARHSPGPESRPLWNESYWFAFYDPKQEIGVAVRLGMLPNVGYSNIYILVTHEGSPIYSLIDQRAPIPAIAEKQISVLGYTIAFEEPLNRFRLTYNRDGEGFDVTWEGYSPTLMWPRPPGSVDAVSRHIEHAGRVKGTVWIGEKEYAIDCLGRRDHSWGGERDWSKILRWDYLSGEIDEKFWFNAVGLTLAGFPEKVYVGGIWNGEELLSLSKVEMNVPTAEGGTRALGVELRMTDERGREHEVSGEMLASSNVWFGKACLREGFARFTYGDRVGYGVHEHGYNEVDAPTLEG